MKSTEGMAEAPQPQDLLPTQPSFRNWNSLPCPPMPVLAYDVAFWAWCQGAHTELLIQLQAASCAGFWGGQPSRAPLVTRVRAHVDSLEVGMGEGHEAAPTNGPIVS